MWLIILGVVVLLGLFKPYTGLFGNTYYSPKSVTKPEQMKITHRSFRLTKGY